MNERVTGLEFGGEYRSGGAVRLHLKNRQSSVRLRPDFASAEEFLAALEKVPAVDEPVMAIEDPDNVK
jgi:hypothetical protein